MRVLQLPHRTAVASDLFALVVFVTIGLASHHGGVSATGYARDAVPFAACWLLAAGAFDLYRRPRAGALLGTWLVGVTGGVLVRALTLWRLDGDDVVFLGVALGFTLLFVTAFRTVVAFAAPRRRLSTPPSGRVGFPRGRLRCGPGASERAPRA